MNDFTYYLLLDNVFHWFTQIYYLNKLPLARAHVAALQLAVSCSGLNVTLLLVPDMFLAPQCV